MNAAAKLGHAFRSLSGLLSARDVRDEDEIRAANAGGPLDARAEQIHREAAAVRKSIDNA